MPMSTVRRTDTTVQSRQGPEAFASGPGYFVGPTGLEPMTFYMKTGSL